MREARGILSGGKRKRLEPEDEEWSELEALDAIPGDSDTGMEEEASQRE